MARLADNPFQGFVLKLIACSDCHAQYDVAGLAPDAAVTCRCGTTLAVVTHVGADRAVQRCSACGALAKESEDDCSYCGAEIIHLADAGSLICPECFARNGDDARFCLACGVGFDPVPMTGERSELRCPPCDRLMSVRVVGGIEIQECGKCYGLWAPGAGFEALIDRAARAAREQALAGEIARPRVDGANPAAGRVEYRRCPECSSLMGRKNFRKRSGVVIDHCAEHGTWLDAHELEQIAGFVLSGRAERAERINAAEQSARERAAADAAMRRAMSTTPYSNGTRGEGDGSSHSWGSLEWDAAETVFGLLKNLLSR